MNIAVLPPQTDHAVHTAAHDALRRWPRITAHVIAASLGYATATLTASVGRVYQQENV